MYKHFSSKTRRQPADLERRLGRIADPSMRFGVPVPNGGPCSGHHVIVGRLCVAMFGENSGEQADWAECFRSDWDLSQVAVEVAVSKRPRLARRRRLLEIGPRMGAVGQLLPLVAQKLATLSGRS
jgi:hypothetical protein